MKATTTTKNCSSLVADFLKEKYMETLGSTIAHIRKNTIKSIETFISLPEEKEKYQGMRKSIIPQSESDIQTGFEHVKDHYPSLSSDPTKLVIPYGHPKIIGGKTFSAEYFERELKPMPGKYFPGIFIALDPKHIKELEDVVYLGKRSVEKLWAEKDFGNRVEVQFMNQKNEKSDVIPFIFAWWFAEQLAREYLKWCKEEQDLANKEVLNKAVAITECISTKRPYPTCLTSDTLLRSTALANFSSNDRGNYKKQRPNT
jgi:hypothetical protein